LRNPICWLLPNSKADNLVRTIWYILNFCNYELWHNLGLDMQLQLPIELIHNLNKKFIHHEIHVAITTLVHYLF
jgi:hypothetical protein